LLNDTVANAYVVQHPCSLLHCSTVVSLWLRLFHRYSAQVSPCRCVNNSSSSSSSSSSSDYTLPLQLLLATYCSARLTYELRRTFRFTGQRHLGLLTAFTQITLATTSG
jgi:hypothetical protein